jgi:AcrR family transcriptional regulator
MPTTNNVTSPGEAGAAPTASKMLNPAAPDSRKRQKRGIERATQILGIAQQMFCDRGYNGTSMDEIAEAVGILKGSLYYYVDSKEDLLFRIVLGVHAEMRKIADDAEARTDLTPLDRVVHYVRGQLLRNAEDITALTVYHNDWLRLEGERLDQIRTERRAHVAQILGLLEAARDAGEVPETTDLQLAQRHMFAVTIWPYTWYKVGGPVSPAALAESGAAFVRAGLASSST